MPKIVLTADQVVSRKAGWVSYIDAGGTNRKIRASAVECPDHPFFNPPTAQPQPIGELKMPEVNDKPKKAAKKTESSGIRTIGGKAVNLGHYVKAKAAGGGISYHNGDQVAEKLAGKSLDEVYTFAAAKLKVPETELRAKYKKLNPGMQRMSLGNRLRKALGLTTSQAA